MAAQNMCKAVQGHLTRQERPLYLQPVDAGGNYPWMESTSTSSTTGSASTASTSTTETTRTGRKREASEPMVSGKGKGRRQ